MLVLRRWESVCQTFFKVWMPNIYIKRCACPWNYVSNSNEWAWRWEDSLSLLLSKSIQSVSTRFTEKYLKIWYRAEWPKHIPDLHLRHPVACMFICTHMYKCRKTCVIYQVNVCCRCLKMRFILFPMIWNSAECCLCIAYSINIQ